MTKTISAGNAPKIFIETIGGDLSLVGWESDEILLKGDDDEIRSTQSGNEVKVSSSDDISIRVPKSASVYVQHVGGDASIRGILGGIELKEISGDLSIRDVDSVDIDKIESDFSLRGAKGHLFIKKANSDVSIREIDGNVTLEFVGNDLALRDVRGNVTATVGNDIVFYLNPQPGKNYTINGGDDILLVMPPKANATLAMSANEISVDWEGNELEEDATSGTIILGNGSASITLSAGNDIRVSNQADAGNFAQDFGNFAGMDMDWSGFGERISRQVEQAARRAGKQAERASSRINAKLNVGVGRWNWDVFQKGGGPVPSRPQASEEERMAILKMLQEKKITAEEADKLLSALEGEA